MTNDQEIWDRFRAGDQLAFTVMFEKYLPVLFDYGSRLTSRHTELEDLIQDLFIYLWRKKNSLSQVSSVKGYLLKSLRRKIASEIYSKSQLTVKIEDHYDELEFNIDLSPESILINQQTDEAQKNLINHLIQQLPKRQKEAIYLRFYENFEIDEICSIMDVNRRNIYKLLKEGLGKIKKILPDFQ